jgi:hypothetical protein
MSLVCLVLLAHSGVSLFAQLPADASAEKISRDAVQLAVQGICPVSGQKLGSHGTPIKAKIGDEVLFLCCKGCLQGKVEPKHWVTIHANFAKAQKVCPVMKHELPKNPKWTIVEGQIVFVCCPPCTDRIQAAPQSFLKQVEELYVSSLEEQSIRR